MTHVIQTKRKSMMHFQDMRPIDFTNFVQGVEKESNCFLKDIKVTMKVDGAAARFGRDYDGRYFFEGSRTGPIFERKAFSAYALGKDSAGDMIERAHHYDDLFDLISTASIMKEIPHNAKVICEVLYNPMAIVDADGATFVTVKYDKSRLGSILTIIPYDVINSTTGEAHLESYDIIQMLLYATNPEIKIISADLHLGEINIGCIIEPLINLTNESKRVLQSRRNVDKEQKFNLINIIDNVKRQLGDYILNHPNIYDKYKLGNEIEGIVLHLPDRQYKLTTNEFKESKRHENI